MSNEELEESAEMDYHNQDESHFSNMAQKIQKLQNENNALNEQIICIEQERVKRTAYEAEQRSFKPTALTVRALKNGYMVTVEGVGEYFADNLLDLLAIFERQAHLLSPTQPLGSFDNSGLVGGLQRAPGY